MAILVLSSELNTSQIKGVSTFFWVFSNFIMYKKKKKKIMINAWHV